ncbi:hypothetical protein C3941_09485 [Kaistia algarum]|uniref:hypothetical protein n=1 Tax=Kaistia algarum TaxID=2083279 RepID=UPI000CE858F2|nr:hypothetical protein [Kaistia algarum]MCX5512290.1 hypothetical protein [Kaistia algarum]PPE80381.1 hypothetical protein C3941_09485 [Kaistia algarum]
MPDIGLIKAILAGEVAAFNLSSALDFGSMPEGWGYWEERARDGLDAEARAKLEAMLASE